MLTKLKDLIFGKLPLNSPSRSPQWGSVRARHLILHPLCAVCEGKENLNVHHIKPFHLHPELELDPSNLITLCESGKKGLNCHLLIGHLGNFKNVNLLSVEDAAIWNAKLKEEHFEKITDETNNS